MRFYRCKCGNAHSWTSIGIPACKRCGKCGSSLAQSPDEHETPEHHQFVTRYNQKTGAPFEVCGVCICRKEELERLSELDGQPPTGI